MRLVHRLRLLLLPQKLLRLPLLLLHRLRRQSPMPGNIIRVEVEEGDQIKAGQLLVVLEAMKMENEILAPHDGTVAQVIVSKGSTVETDSPLIVLA